MDKLPNNLDAERNLIGLCLLEGHIPQSAKALDATDFYDVNYRSAWHAFLDLDRQGKEIEPFTAFDIMANNGASPSFKMMDLANTSHGMIHGVNERVWVNQLKECSLKRYLIKELTNQISALQTETGADVIRNLKAKIDELEIHSEAMGGFRDLAEIIDKDVLPALEDLHNHKNDKIPTGFKAIDHVIGGGLSTSDLLLVAGVPGSGKSAFVLQMAANIARQGTPVAFLSGEMTDKENIFRLLTQTSRIPNLNSLMHITATEKDDLYDWAAELKKLPMMFDSRTYDLASINKAMRGLIETRQVKVLVIDYIQLLKLDRNKRQERYERITEVSQEIKRTAMEYGIAVIEVAQFNRVGAKSDKPSMHDLEGSSQLEKDTSLIFIIDRELNSDAVTLRIVKGRNTGTCELDGTYLGKYLTFEF